MTDQTPSKPIVIAPQVVATVCLFISFVAGILASRNIISKDTLAYLGTAEFQAVVGSFMLAGAGLWALIKNRPHGLIQSTAKLEQVDAVVTKPKTASEIPVSNVVPSVDAASRVPGITQS